jgi:spectinomycin phosphotransferase
MLEPPEIELNLIFDQLWDEYNIRADRLTFLALGADVNTAVYRVEVGDTNYFLKLRKGDFDEISVAVPHFLSQHGLAAISAPLGTQSGLLWGTVRNYRMILYPFVAGQDGYQQTLSTDQWLAFGVNMRDIHSTKLPKELRLRIPYETYSPNWRKRVRNFQRQVETVEYADPIATQLAAFMIAQRDTITQLVDCAEQLAKYLLSQSRRFVLCHGDNHPGNLLLPNSDPTGLYIVDWDNPLYAPCERDLAMIGGTSAWSRAEDVGLFYRGYHGVKVNPLDGSQPQAEIDPVGLRYYRCERIIVDIAEFCQQLLTDTAGGEDRAQSFAYFTGAFLPGHEVELAISKDQSTIYSDR